jgi:hypothetical protein
MRRLSAVLPLAAVLAAVASRPLAAQRSYVGDEYTAVRTADVDARGARRLEVEGRSGTLRIQGVDGLSQVRVRGTARASRRDWLDAIRLVARRDGDVVVVRADIPDWNTRDDWSDGNGVRALDLVLEVPRGMAADVVDGSGELEIRGVGALDLRDGSGEIDVEDVGSARIEDGSGEVRVRDVRGDLRVNDGSGDIRASGVRGSVIVASAGSGGVDVRDVGGDFTIEEGRGRGVTYRDVRGQVRLPVDHRSIARDRERDLERAERDRERERARAERDRARAERDRERAAYRRSWY